jgi:XTP/dITP diphosphohydrolase
VKLVLATQNHHKVEEIKAILAGFDWEIVSLSEMDSDFQVVEDGKTYEENARKKAEMTMRRFGFITLGEDTGLEVDFLKGQPGIYSARFAGEKATYEQNRIKLLTALKNVPIHKRTARFRCTCALACPEKFNRKTEIFEGVCEGYITEIESGSGSFGYDPIFKPKKYNKTFAELSSEEKNKMSHRSRALKKVKKYLEHLTSDEQ